MTKSTFTYWNNFQNLLPTIGHLEQIEAVKKGMRFCEYLPAKVGVDIYVSELMQLNKEHQIWKKLNREINDDENFQINIYIEENTPTRTFERFVVPIAIWVLDDLNIEKISQKHFLEKFETYTKFLIINFSKFDNINIKELKLKSNPIFLDFSNDNTLLQELNAIFESIH